MNIMLKDGRCISGDIVAAHDLVLTTLARIDMGISDVDLCWLRQALEASKVHAVPTQCAVMDALIAHIDQVLGASFPNTCVGPYPDVDSGECGATGFCPAHQRASAREV